MTQSKAVRGGGMALASKRILIAVETNALCRDRELDDIPTDEICRGAGVSRSSFYRAFGSKYDIATWCQTFPLTEGIGKMGRTRTCSEGLTFSFEGLAMFKNLIRSSKGSLEMAVCDEASRRLIKDMIGETLRKHRPEEVDEDLEFQIDWVVVAGMIMAQDWMSGRLDKTPAEMAHLIEESYPPRLRGLLNSPVEPSSGGPFDMGAMIVLALKGASEPL